MSKVPAYCIAEIIHRSAALKQPGQASVSYSENTKNQRLQDFYCSAAPEKRPRLGREKKRLKKKLDKSPRRRGFPTMETAADEETHK